MEIPSQMDDDIIDDFLVPRNLSGRLRTRWLEDGRLVEFHSISNTLGIAYKLTLDGETPPDGRYTLNDGITRFEVLNGLVTHEYYIERFTHQGFDILVDCSRINGYGVGCLIYTEDGLLPNGVYKLKSFNWVKVMDGRIEETSVFRIRA